MRAQHPSTADEIDHLVHRRGAPKNRRTVKRASARHDRRSARRALEILTVPQPHPTHPPERFTLMTQPRITTTAQLLAAIPAMLGYVPTDSGSFVAIALETDQVGTSVVNLVIRTTSEDAAQASTTSTLSGALANNGITAVIVVTIAAPGLRSHAVIEHMLALRELSRVLSCAVVTPLWNAY